MSFKMSYDDEEVKNKSEANTEEILKQFEEFKFASRSKTIVIVIIAILATFCITIVAYARYLDRHQMLIVSEPVTPTLEAYIDKLNTFMTNYFRGERPSDEELIEGALKGYIDAYGDPYTEYLTKEEWQDLDESLSDFVGIGVYLESSKKTVGTVITDLVSDDSPAAIAGIKAGDRVIEVDLEDVSDKDAKYVSNKVRGLEGSTVKIKVDRDGEELEFNVERQKIKAYEIKHEMLEGDIGYIDFDSFTEESYHEFVEAINDIKKQNPKGLILDLRNNTGGYVDRCLNIADLFVDEGKVLLTEEDAAGNRKVETAKSPKQVDLPMVVLVNEYSASASEILTGILKDYKVATILGTQTYGKGVIQQVFTSEDLKFGEGALRVTIEEYFTPNDNAIHEVGITPDIVLELDKNYDSKDRSTDNQLNKALEILKK